MLKIAVRNFYCFSVSYEKIDGEIFSKTLVFHGKKFTFAPA